MNKKILLLTILLCSIYLGQAQTIINFPDQNFKQALINHSPSIDSNGDGEIDTQEAEITLSINIRNKDVSDISGIEYFKNLEELQATDNNLTQIDLSKNISLKRMYVDKNQLTALNVHNNINLLILSAHQNNLKQLDVSKNIKLENLFFSNNQIAQIDVSKNINLFSLSVSDNQITELDVSKNTKLSQLRVNTNKLTNLDVSKNIKLSHLWITENKLTDLDITQNTDLTYFSVYYNQLTGIDVSKNTKLKYLDLGGNQLTKIDVSKNIDLTSLSVFGNELETIDVSKNLNLTSLSTSHNKLTSIDISKNTNLSILNIHFNQLTKIDLSNNKSLTRLSAYKNQLTELDARSCQLERINFSSNPNLKEVFLSDQPLTYREVNGKKIINATVSNCPKLEFICADQKYLSDIYELLKNTNQTSCLLSSDCDTPHNRIEGTVTYDLDGDGCDENDVPFLGEMMTVIQPNSGPAFTAFPNDKGEYTFFIPDGDYRALFPRVRNNAYYQFSENYSQRDISIPDDIDGLTTDFCLKARNNNITDLEIEIIPLNRARPGFTSEYLITYRNMGTLPENASITLNYQEDVLTYESSSTSIDTDSNGQLTWNLGEIQPIYTGEIKISFKLNKPTDSPALNNGDVLAYTVNVSSNTDDNTPDNNTLTLNQEIVNSYDPNDKTCLEGDILDPDDVGKYLHYLIRFENKGTAEAVNVRIKDVIDTSKLDIETLVPLKGSHSFTTTITNENEVEFWFNDINLPFDDANNDGYVLFKIKTKDNLVEGDEIVNGAGIYFDFNPPVITEDEVVIVKREANKTYPIIWTDVVNLDVDGNTVTKTSNTSWNAGAASVNTIPANEDGFIEMTVGDPDTDVMFGLSYENTSYTWNTIDFNMYISKYRETNIVIYQRNKQITQDDQLGGYTRGDKMRVERQGSTVYFKKNGNTLYTLPIDASRSLVADVSLYDKRAQIIDAITSVPAEATAKSVVMNSPEYNSLFEMSSLAPTNGLTNDTKIVLAPNPSNGLLQINSNKIVNKMTIRSFTGQIVYQQEGLEAGGNTNIQLNGASGLYTIVFELEGETIIKKLVKL